jgi:hypothetical protein
MLTANISEHNAHAKKAHNSTQVEGMHAASLRADSAAYGVDGIDAMAEMVT